MGCVNRDTIKTAIAIIQTDRPNFLKGETQEQLTMVVDLWLAAFRDYDTEIFMTAVARTLQKNPYNIKLADVNAEIENLCDAVNGDTVESCIKESWSAICGNRKFKELSALSQEYWGSQDAIDAVGYDENTTYSIIVAQMQRRLPIIMERRKTLSGITPQLVEKIRERRELSGVSELPQIKELTDGGEK